MSFWIVAGAMTLAVAALLALAMLRGRSRAPEGASDVQVYRDQLTEIDRDLARGVLSETEADQVRIEVSRRLLEADRKAQGAAAEGAGGERTSVRAVALVGGVVIAGATGLYLMLGAPGYPDLPLEARIASAEAARENRPNQAVAESQFGRPSPGTAGVDPAHLELVEQLRATMAERPDDLQGWTLLARNEAALGNYAAAHMAQSEVIRIKGAAAGAADFADLADLMILAAGGFVSPEAEAALIEALRRDPTNGPALYYSGLSYAQTGRPDRAFAVWRALLETSDPRDPWYLPVRAQIEDLARRAGVRYVPPIPPEIVVDGPRGPTAADIEAAGDMAPEDRRAMIENMVAGLSDRLANDGGTAQEWAQLIVALSVLGQSDQARAIADEARAAFADEPDLLPVIEEARTRAGIDG